MAEITGFVQGAYNIDAPDPAPDALSATADGSSVSAAIDTAADRSRAGPVGLDAPMPDLIRFDSFDEW